MASPPPRQGLPAVALREGGWPTGLEPATTRTTIWGSTIELRPPSLAGKQDFKILIFFCKQRTGLFPTIPLILAAGGTRISPQPACHGASSSHEPSVYGFARSFLIPRGYPRSCGAAG